MLAQDGATGEMAQETPDYDLAESRTLPVSPLLCTSANVPPISYCLTLLRHIALGPRLVSLGRHWQQFETKEIM